uniref:tetratricopeptide repeat protein n=1 Tax=Psychrobacter sp. TaxID=56811 RepID=UPI00159A0D81|nr:tetratricopeptide repeat protein [Psychrobacter sp.]QJS05536.1 sel1 repeat protein [Psychrobacter sp.]
MQALKNIVINAAMSWALLFGLTTAATATPTSDFEQTKVRAEQGISLSQVVLGGYYADGIGVRQDYAKAFYWYQKSADQGHSGGQFQMGQAYRSGQGVRQDYAKAFYWYQKSANQNNRNAQSAVGISYELGDGVRQNKTTAKEWYGKSCDNGQQIGCDQYKRLNEQGY